MSRSDQEPIKIHTNQSVECIRVNFCPMAIDNYPIDLRSKSHRTHPNVSSLKIVKEDREIEMNQFNQAMNRKKTSQN